VVEAHWPEQVAVADLGAPVFVAAARAARRALLAALDLDDLPT
jgi:hypothetical protein